VLGHYVADGAQPLHTSCKTGRQTTGPVCRYHEVPSAVL
jgi:hypothetical protein